MGPSLVWARSWRLRRRAGLPCGGEYRELSMLHGTGAHFIIVLHTIYEEHFAKKGGFRLVSDGCVTASGSCLTGEVILK